MTDLQDVVDSVYQDLASRIGEGKLADYIPELATVDPKQFGLALCTVDGQVHTAGDADTSFSIQSISKVFTLAHRVSLNRGASFDLCLVERKCDEQARIVQV